MSVFSSERTYPAGCGVARNHDDGADGSVLGDKSGGGTAGCQDEDSTSVLLKRRADGGHGAGLGGGAGNRSKLPQLVEGVDVGDSNLSKQAGLVHHGNGLDGVVTLGGLSRQHDAIGAVKDSVTDIRNLSTGRARVVCHGLEHLCGGDDGLSGDVALGDHHLLGNEDLAGRDLNSKIATGDHDTVSLLENLVEVVNSLLVLNLGNDLDVLALLAEDLADSSYVAAAADERGEDHVDTVLDTKLEIGLVLLGQRREIDVGLGQVDTLLGGDLAVVDALALEGLLVDDLEDLEGQNTVIDVDSAADLNDLGDVLVVDVHVLVVAGGGVLLIGGNIQDCAGLDRDIGIANSVTCADLRALGVEGNGERATSLGPLGLTRVVDNGLVVLVRTVGEVHADDIETNLAQSVDLLGRVGLGANGTDDGGTAVLLGWVVLSVELAEPFNPGPASVEVVQSAEDMLAYTLIKGLRGCWCRGWRFLCFS
jgi:hypothetical protein